jgi:predicted lipid-binding transport protein (Tim44 family)
MVMSIRSPAMQWRILLSLVFCLALAFAPSLAEARAGRSYSFGGHSSFSGMGSRGLRTFENNGAAPIARSLTQTPRAASPAYGMPAYGGSFFHRHPFLTGLFGGFLGSMLFHGMGGFGHVFGGLLQLLLIGGLIWFVFRLISGRGFSFASMGAGMPRSVGAAAAPTALYRGQDATVSDADLNAFQSIHAAVQEGWSRGDLGRLRPLMTPEMLSYFSEELTGNASQGVQNIISDVRLLKGEVSESWEEGDLQYATAYMRWSALDYVVPLAGSPGKPGLPVAGDARMPTEAEEVWTFVRSRGGNWLLSAIQQV